LDQLRRSCAQAASYRELITLLGLRPAGGNYRVVRTHLEANHISTAHFQRVPWNKGRRTIRAKRPLELVLAQDSTYQSFKLKKRLFAEGIKQPKCELCGWAECAPDGRVPLELDHINGLRNDNRLENLRILCPNCHSLQPTHRGLNIRPKDSTDS